MKKRNSDTVRESLQKKRRLLFEITVFPMLAAIMFCSKLLMEALPNIHIVGMLCMLYTVIFRVKALIPIYLYVFLTGLYAGFDIWWIPYLYIWAILWAFTMLLPKNMPRAAAIVVYSVVCGLHGFLYGTLYAPAQALLFGLNFEQMLAWIAVGFPFDVIHCISNLCTGLLIYPLSELLKKLMARSRYKI
jgi:energy-coupling factor transport system substrate-specific component